MLVVRAGGLANEIVCLFCSCQLSLFNLGAMGHCRPLQPMALTQQSSSSVAE